MGQLAKVQSISAPYYGQFLLPLVNRCGEQN
jgi:hypothetical protein